MINISDLTDKELRSVLMEHGETPGPITGTTRRVYELQLTSILSGTNRNRTSAASKKNTSAASRDKKKRRQTLDTLRTTEKPKFEPRRSEKLIPNIPSNLGLTLSDYSDSELPELNPSPDKETPQNPPDSLIFTRDTPRQARKRRGIKDPPLFSESEDDKPPRKQQKPRKTKPSILPAVLTVLVVVGVVGAGGYYTYHKHLPSPGPPTHPRCTDLPFTMTVNECDELYQQFSKQKKDFDVEAGLVECGYIEGSKYRQSPNKLQDRQLLFHLREDLNYSIFILKQEWPESIFIELGGEAELAEFRPEQSVFYYSTLTPSISYFCAVSRVISNFAFYILTATGVLVMAQIAHKVYQWRKAREKQEMGQMFELIDQIIEELQRNYSKYQTDPINYVPYVAIPHARDRLLLPSERTAMKHIWDRAVQFIAQHESRVRVEMRRVQSEDFPVWYWLEASKCPEVQPDSTSPDFLYPDLDVEFPSDKGKGS